MNEQMAFIGKWAFTSTIGKPEDKRFMSLDPSTSQIITVQVQSPDSNQRFNAYGMTVNGFWIQGNNGKYIVYVKNGYQASEERTGTPSLFELEAAGSSVRLVERASGIKYYVEIEGDTIKRIPASLPTPASLLQQVIVSPGLEEIQATKIAEGIDLTWVYLAYANLQKIHFSGSVLSYADLTGCNLYEAFFQGQNTDLSHACFRGAELTYAQLARATISNADFSQATMIHTQMPDSILHNCLFIGANLTKASLICADLKDAVLTGATLKDAGAIGARFDRANLSEVDFTNAALIHVQIPGAKFINAKLDNQDLTTAKIDELTDFTGASMQHVRLINSALSNVSFAHADLTDSVFDEADLRGADFSYANLTRASLTNGVKLYSSTLANATLTNANLTGAQLGAKEEACSLYMMNIPDSYVGVVPSDIRLTLQEAGLFLSADATITVRVPGKSWMMVDKKSMYTITGMKEKWIVWRYTDVANAAVLSGAYMPNAILKDANLYAVNMSGVNWYGDAADATNADLEEVNLTCANMGSMDFSQAHMNGCDLGYANLIDANFNGASLRASVNDKQTSLAFSNLQGATFLQAQLQGADLTNAAVSLDQGPFFTLPESYCKPLDQLSITADLRDQFQKHGYPLEAKAIVICNAQGSSWTIKNGSNPVFFRYNILKIQNELNVSGGPIGVHLFDLPQSMISEFDEKKLTSDICTAFSDNGYPLLSGAKIDQVVVAGGQWHISNDNAESTTEIQKGYVEFNVIHDQADCKLHVYGSVLIVLRIGDGDTQEQVLVALATTSVTQDVMDESTICPNGQKLSVYLHQKPPKHIAWEQMMTAATPPKPPDCIPDPFNWCPNQTLSYI